MKEQQNNKIEQALSLYNYDMTDEQVREAVKKIIAEKVPQNDTLEVKKFLMGSVELTTLKTTDSEESVMAFTERVNAFDEQSTLNFLMLPPSVCIPVLLRPLARLWRLMALK